MHVRNNLAVLMAHKRIRLSALSKMTGISRTTLTSLYYNKEKGITYAVIEKLCQALECDLSDLMITI